MNQNLLDELIGVAPPSRVDVGAVIARTRRRRRLRRLAAGGSAATAVVAVLAASPLLSAPPVPPPTAASLPAGAAPPPTLRQLRDALENATAAEAPGTGWVYMPDVPGEKRTPDGHPQMWINKEPVSFEGRSGVTRDGRKGGLYVSLRPAARYECDGTVPDCGTVRGAAGLTLTRWAEKPGRGLVFYGVDVTLPDRVHALRLLAVNYFGGDGSAPVAAEPVFTRAQLEAIAVDAANRLAGR
ncbi:hypothetical protein ACQP2X_09590 [Actinoplanes sp. CA-131856]